MIRYREGDLITLAKEGHFDVITHGCNCFCTMGAGIAPQMAKAFGCDTFMMEDLKYKGNINKLGTIDYEIQPIFGTSKNLVVVNSYTQYRYGRNHADGDKIPVDYDAIRLCMRKINRIFKDKTIGLPKIGAGLAGGDWSKISKILVEELNSMDIWVINYNK
jgi:O-acetyl-ADP-ribose deacetylase (regulator of RNase III)